MWTCSDGRIAPVAGYANTFENPDGGGEVVDTTRSAQGSGENFNGGDEIVSEAVVQVALVKCGRSAWDLCGRLETHAAVKTLPRG